MEIIEELEFKDKQLVITKEAKDLIHTITRWANFLAVLGFILVGLMGIFSIMTLVFSLATLSITYVPFLKALLFVALTIMYYFPSMYLYRTTQNLDRAVRRNNSRDANEGFQNLKLFYQFIAVYSLITACFYIGMIYITFKTINHF